MCFLLLTKSLMVVGEVGVELKGRNGCTVPIALAMWTLYKVPVFFLLLRAERDRVAPSLSSYL